MQKKQEKVYLEVVINLMKNKNLIILIVIGAILYYNQTNVVSFLGKLKSKIQILSNESQKNVTTDTQIINTTDPQNEFPVSTEKPKLNNNANTPGPLQTFLNNTLNNNTSDESVVNVSGIINKTNAERINSGKRILIENLLLNKTAYIKAKDMLDRQYFEHMSPDGKGVSNLVTDAGYEYITVGENLALGNFATSSDIVTAWMNSPRHRANILNNSYTEIGVGIVSGTYEGRTVWIAVQHFGRPLADCPATSVSLKNEIMTHEKDATLLQTQLDSQRSVISAPGANTLENYTQLVSEYNSLVKKYNALINKTKEQIAVYNKQIQIFSACISQK